MTTTLGLRLVPVVCTSSAPLCAWCAANALGRCFVVACTPPAPAPPPSSRDLFTAAQVVAERLIKARAK